jgi:histidinol-phosphate aminotransferase
MKRSPADAVPESIRRILPYIPGRPIKEVRKDIGREIARLASNENPLGASPKALAAAERALDGVNRYPDGGDFYLREALAAKHGVGIDNIILGAGSSELINIAALALLRPGGAGVTSCATFPLYPIAIEIAGAELIEVPLREFAIDLGAMAERIPAKSRLIYLANPNNPTGTIFTATEFDAFLKRVPEDVLVVLDEAYSDYVENSDYSRSIELVREGRNVFVLRTFSKAHGLAGLRIGYGIATSQLLLEFEKVRVPYNTSSVAEAAALAAMDDGEHVRRSVELNRAGVAQLSRGLEALGTRFVTPTANFVMVEVGRDARLVSAELLKFGVMVRGLGFAGLASAIRVTVGTREENEEFLRAMTHVRERAPGVS